MEIKTQLFEAGRPKFSGRFPSMACCRAALFKLVGVVCVLLVVGALGRVAWGTVARVDARILMVGQYLCKDNEGFSFVEPPLPFTTLAYVVVCRNTARFEQVKFNLTPETK